MNPANQIQLFNFNENLVRCFMRGDQPWFVASDVCRILDIVNTSDAISALEAEEKDGIGITDPIGREQMTNIINEPGFYRLVFKSRKKEAKVFQKWVFTDVLPALRKTGSFSTKPTTGLDEQFWAKVEHLVAMGGDPIKAFAVVSKAKPVKPVLTPFPSLIPVNLAEQPLIRYLQDKLQSGPFRATVTDLLAQAGPDFTDVRSLGRWIAKHSAAIESQCGIRIGAMAQRQSFGKNRLWYRYVSLVA